MSTLVWNNANNVLKIISCDYGELSYEWFSKNAKSAVKEAVTEVTEEINGKLDRNREFLAPTIKEWNKLLHASKISSSTDEILTQKCRNARSNIKNTV